MDSIVSIKALKKHFPIKSTSLFGRTKWNRALDDINLEIERGEALGIVGESGSGKTTLGKALLGLYSATEGTIEYKSVNDEAMNLSVVFQDPFSSLNPRMTIFDIVKESLESRRGGKRNEDFRSKVLDALNSVGLSEEQMFRYPHEFSGGQRQRIAIARAIVSDPLFIVFDEPTSGLDVSVQAQILNLLKELKSRSDLSYVFISHNIGVIKYICTRIAVMYRGKIVEIADNKELFDNPMHPYTEHLLSVVPEINKSQTGTVNEETGEKAESDFVATSVGCIYCSKCPIQQKICTESPPQNITLKGSHIVACWVRGKVNS